MNKIKEQVLTQNHSGAIVMGVALWALSFALFIPFAHANENDTEEMIEDTTTVDETSHADDTDAAQRSAMKAQIESLRAIIEARKADMMMKRDAMKDEVKAKRQFDRANFMASLEGLNEDEKKAAMLDFISQIKDHLAAVKAERAAMQNEFKTQRDALKDEFKTQRDAMKDEFKSMLEGRDQNEIRTALMERIAELRAKIEARLNGTDTNQMDESDDTEAKTDDEMNLVEETNGDGV